MSSHIPLNALRAFESAARSGSFANAARELGVSSAAVSQQVKLLEEFWGTTLFIRQGNRIALTDAGQTAYPQLGQSMQQLGVLSDVMRRVERKTRLVLSAPQSVAETWLAPKLVPLRSESMFIPMEIRVENDPIDFARDKIDLRIFYGHDLYRDHNITPLFTDRLVAVASPAFVAKHGAMLDSIADPFLIHTDWGRDFASSPNWSFVFAKDRIIDSQVGLRVQASSVARTFAENGLGIALIPEGMALDKLVSGHLVKYCIQNIPMEHDYRVARPKNRKSGKDIQAVIEALKT